MEGRSDAAKLGASGDASTPQFRDEASLRESEQRLRWALQAAGGGAWDWDLTTDEVWWSPPMYDLWGVAPGTRMQLDSALAIIYEDDRDRVRREIEEAIERHADLKLEFRIRHRVLGERWMASFGQTICDESGQVVKLTGIALDITDRKQAEEALHEALATAEDGNRLLCALMEYVPEGITIADAALNLTHVSRYGQELLGAHQGVSLEDAVRKWNLFHADGETPMATEDLPLVRAVRDGQVVINAEIIHINERGERMSLQCTAGPFRDGNGEIVGGIVAWRDISEQRRAEKERAELVAKLEAQNAELERFTYTVSHDLKSPLITIRGYLGVLAEDLADAGVESAQYDLTRIATAADKMSILLSNLLELSRIGRLANPSENVPLEELVDEAVHLVRGQIEAKNVRVETSSDLPIVYGDRIRLVEVLQNLIDNAVKYMGDQPHPRIEIGARKDDDDTVCFVRDNGIGIEPRFLERVFGLFDQLDPKSGGTGIGLALVKRIIEIHGGRVWVESQGEGQGATFSFLIPSKATSSE